MSESEKRDERGEGETVRRGVGEIEREKRQKRERAE